MGSPSRTCRYIDVRLSYCLSLYDCYYSLLLIAGTDTARKSKELVLLVEYTGTATRPRRVTYLPIAVDRPIRQTREVHSSRARELPLIHLACGTACNNADRERIDRYQQGRGPCHRERADMLLHQSADLL